MADSVIGGAELLQGKQNPWFIQNTATIKYCVKIDEDSFGATRESATNAISIAINYWKAEFKDARWSGESQGIKVATQVFEEVACSNDVEVTEDNVDIVFQFGVLSKSQIDIVRTPTRYVAFTVRTAYDETQFKGKGFVYVSPEQGDLRADDQEIARSPWAIENGRLLQFVLMHELGHIYGLTLKGNGLMSANFVEWMLNKKNAAILAQIKDEPNFFKYENTNRLHCKNDGLDPFISYVFDVPPGWKCIKIETNDTGFTIKATNQVGTEWTPMGKGTYFQEKSPVDRSKQWDTAVNFSFTVTKDNQNFFPNLPLGYHRLELYQFLVSERFGAIYESVNGTKRPLFGTMRPNWYSLNAVIDNKPYVDFFKVGLESWSIWRETSKDTSTDTSSVKVAPIFGQWLER